jgi:hypothetical protein
VSSRAWVPDLFVTRREDRALALISGPWAEKVTRLAGVTRRFSQHARGWVVPLPEVEDVLAAASVDRLRVIERRVEPGGVGSDSGGRGLMRGNSQTIGSLGREKAPTTPDGGTRHKKTGGGSDHIGALPFSVGRPIRTPGRTKPSPQKPRGQLHPESSPNRVDG